MELSPCTREVVVRSPEGFHLRPVQRLAALAANYPCEILVRKGPQTADAKSTLALLSVVSPEGTTLIVETRGPGAEEALDAVVQLFEANFHLDPGAAAPPA